MTGTHTHHSTNASDILNTLKAQAASMINDEGVALPNTGFLKTKLHGSKISHILSHTDEKPQWRGTPNYGVWNFVFDGKAYTMKVAIRNVVKGNREIVLTWDHRD